MGKIRSLMTIGFEHHMQTLVQKAFGRKGTKVFVADSVEQAIELVRTTVPEMIMVDNKWIRMSLLDLYEKLYEANPECASSQIMLMRGAGRSGDGEWGPPTGFASIPNSGMEIAAIRESSTI